jgi:3D (Asp-Asp-Asp) domain-containing protein
MKKTILSLLIGFVLVGYPLEIQNSLISKAKADELTDAPSFTVWVTAYSSTPEETDSTPFVTASNTEVREGTLAANFLPFGTRVQIPELFGDRVFVVEDRMHQRKTNFVDVWMPTKEAALELGITRTEIVVVQ